MKPAEITILQTVVQDGCSACDSNYIPSLSCVSDNRCILCLHINLSTYTLLFCKDAEPFRLILWVGRLKAWLCSYFGFELLVMKIVSSFHKPGIKCIFLIATTLPITGRKGIKDCGHLKLLSTKFWSNLITHFALEEQFLNFFC